MLESKFHEGGTKESCSLLFFSAPNTADWIKFKKGVGKERAR